LAITAIFLSVTLPMCVHAQTFVDIKSTTFEKGAIAESIQRGWIQPLTTSTFGYGMPISQESWLRMLMFLRTKDACPELGAQSNVYWTADNIRHCLAGAGVPIMATGTDVLRRDEAMQQLFALRRRSFAFRQLETEPPGFIPPTDLTTVPADRQGAMIAALRLKLLFTSKHQLAPASPLLREDAVLAVTRFAQWEAQGGVDTEVHTSERINAETQLDHWRDLDTDLYVLRIKARGDTEIKPILPRRSFNPVSIQSTTTHGVVPPRDEFVYERVSDLAQGSGAIAAVNGSYFNVEWPWGALEDVALLNGKTVLARADRSAFIVCRNENMYIDSYDVERLTQEKCIPKHALGAGPMFMSRGNILTTSTHEGFAEYTKWERRVGSNARTAVAVSADHATAYMIVVAGKSYPAFGRGSDTLGAFLKSKYPDIRDAMMYDGGSSSALYADGKVRVGSGQSGNQSERAVVSALGVFSKNAEARAVKQFQKDQMKHWDKQVTVVRMEKPEIPFVWRTVQQAKNAGIQVRLTGSRGTNITLKNIQGHLHQYHFTFDLIATSSTASLAIARREGAHEKGWRIPTELHVLNLKDGNDTDVIRLFVFLPSDQRPDLKTFDAIAFAKNGIVFGDATGRLWYYHAKTKQFSPARFSPPPRKKIPPVKKSVLTPVASSMKTS